MQFPRLNALRRLHHLSTGALLAAVLPLIGQGSTPGCSSLASSSLAVPFTLDRPATQGSIAELDAWCAAVGSAIVDINAAAAVGSTADRNADIVVISWNVHGNAGDLARLVDAVRQRDLLGTTPSDVVLLMQEVVRWSDEMPAAVPPQARIAAALPRPAAIWDLRDTARALGLNLAYVPSMRNGRTQDDRGNAIMTTLPIDRVDAFELPLGRQRRVGVAVTVRTGVPLRPQLRLVSVHFDTAVLPFRGGPAAWRARQARATIATLVKQRVPTIIGGDLNTWWAGDEPAVRTLRRAYPEAVEPQRLGETWRGPLGASNRLDYLFASGLGKTIEVHRIGDRFGSDHHPIFTRLRAATGR